MAKVYTIQRGQSRNNSYITITGTLEELTNKCSYTLECGAMYEHEKGNSKIHRNPKTIKSLLTNLNRAVNNSAANGYAGVLYIELDTVLA